jgi:hypothetical protein
LRESFRSTQLSHRKAVHPNHPPVRTTTSDQHLILKLMLINHFEFHPLPRFWGDGSHDRSCCLNWGTIMFKKEFNASKNFTDWQWWQQWKWPNEHGFNEILKQCLRHVSSSLIMTCIIDRRHWRDEDVGFNHPLRPSFEALDLWNVPNVYFWELLRFLFEVFVSFCLLSQHECSEKGDCSPSSDQLVPDWWAIAIAVHNYINTCLSKANANHWMMIRQFENEFTISAMSRFVNRDDFLGISKCKWLSIESSFLKNGALSEFNNWLSWWIKNLNLPLTSVNLTENDSKNLLTFSFRSSVGVLWLYDDCDSVW